MRIAIDVRAAADEPAGIGKIVLNLTHQLAKIDPDNSYLLYGNTPGDPLTGNANFTSVARNFGRGPIAMLLWHLWAVLHARYSGRVDRFIAIASLQSSVLTKDRVILIVPDITNVLFPEFHTGKRTLMGRLLLRLALKRARHVIAISDHTRKDILEYAAGRIPGDKVTVAHIACEEAFARTPPADDLGRVLLKHGIRQPYVLFVGTIEPRKNLPRLIEAFSGVASQVSNLDLVLAGRKGWKWKETAEAASRSGAAGRIRFLEFVPPGDLPSLYRGAVMFVYPSLYEGFGIPPLEAMTCGVPVITSNCSSLPEVTGDAAILVDPLDAAALRESMLLLLRDAGLRNNLAAAGTARAQQFSWERFARTTLQCTLEER